MCILLLYSVMQAVIKTCFFVPPTETSIIIVHLNSKLDPGGKSSIQSFGKVTLHLYRILKGNNDCTSPSQNAYTSQVINQAFLRLVLILNLLLKAFNGTKKKNYEASPSITKIYRIGSGRSIFQTLGTHWKNQYLYRKPSFTV